MRNKGGKKILLTVATVVVLVATPFIIEFSHFFGPIDTFPRLYKTAQCSDDSWKSVLIQRKKAYWFSSDTDILVKVFDSNGTVVHQERLLQVDLWGDVASHISGDTPAGFCNKALFMQGR